MLIVFMTIPGLSEKIVSIGESSTESIALATIQDNYSSDENQLVGVKDSLSRISTMNIEIYDGIRSGDKDIPIQYNYSSDEQSVGVKDSLSRVSTMNIEISDDIGSGDRGQ